MISYDEFSKIELRIGTVISVEQHPDADKLLVVKVDLGSEERQLVAGLKEYYSPEELAGKKVVVVSNLEHAKLRGVESQGMILAAEDKEGNVAVLTTDKKIENGAEVL